jgi:hypothetical protein
MAFESLELYKLIGICQTKGLFSILMTTFARYTI